MFGSFVFEAFKKKKNPTVYLKCILHFYVTSRTLESWTRVDFCLWNNIRELITRKKNIYIFPESIKRNVCIGSIFNAVFNNE